MQATLTSKGQITIPKPIREAFHLRASHRVDFVLAEGGQVLLVPVTRSVKRLKGILPKPARAVSLEAMEAAIVRGAAMIGLDTNVLVRYIVQDEPAQARAATRLIERECTPAEPGYISLLMLAEVVWVLGRAYGHGRADSSRVLAALLSTAELQVESPDLARDALHAYRNGAADFADYLIGLLHWARGCSATLTFDKRAAKSGWHRLAA